MGLRKLVEGVGVNDVFDVSTWVEVGGRRVKCPYYRVWRDMLKRCYSSCYHKRQPTYKNCEVCDEWKVFSNFKGWMMNQDWENKHLDKDLLKEGNKIYCPDYCIFVNQTLNKFTHEKTITTENMRGVNWHKAAGKYHARCNNPFTGVRESLGFYHDSYEGHLAWKTRKHELACMLADSELVSDPRLAEALRTRYL